MPATPLPDGTLHAHKPAPDLRYDFGNTRLFAAADGAGNISRFVLQEGIAVLKHWTVSARLDGVPIQWTEAEAVGRLWTLRGTALGIAVTLETLCDGTNPALAQRWTVTNTSATKRVFTVSLDAGFDLHEPDVRVGATATTARVYTFVRDHPVAHRALGYRRWRVLDTLNEAQKRLRPRGTDALSVIPLRDGISVQGDLIATVRAGAPLAEQTSHKNGALLRWRVPVAGPSRYTLPVIVAIGAEADADPGAVEAMCEDARDYAAWLTNAFEHADPLLRSLYVASLNVTLAMYKELPSGFAGFWAGPGYAYPPRIYFRDSYWTALNALPYRPEWVRRHLITLASGVHPDGTCPSGVIDRAILPFEDQEVPGAADWLPDHHDSPAFYVLLLHAYVQWTGDRALLDVRLDDGRTLWDCARAALRHLSTNPAKAQAPNDWADNVLRSEWVTYDLALLAGALNAAADLAARRSDPTAAGTYSQDARQIARLLDVHGWDEQRGYYIDYRRTGDPDFVENHLALDTLVALRFGVVPEDRAARVLDAARRILQTRHNSEQPYGDWGVMCCYPLYQRQADLFAKSSRAYNYHNGAEWPYLSAMYAQILLERGDPDWRYVLTRWWVRQLEQGQLTPLEYTSPAQAPGALLQGWSGMAISAMLCGGLSLCPDSAGQIAPTLPPWGAGTFNHLMVLGVPRTVAVSEDGVRIT